MRQGALASIVMGVGSCMGDMVYAGLSFAGVAYFLKAALFQRALWVGGSLALAYFTFTMAKEFIWPGKVEEIVAEENKPSKPLVSLFFSGLLLALASPSSILWFVAIGGSLIAASGSSGTYSAVAFFSGFFLAGILWTFFIAYIASVGGKLLGGKMVRILSGISAVLFAYFAAKVFWEGWEIWGWAG